MKQRSSRGQDAYTKIEPSEHRMPTTHITEMQEDVHDAARQLEMIYQRLRGHALFLRSRNIDHLIDDVLLVENQAGALALSIQDLKGAASRMAKAA